MYAPNSDPQEEMIHVNVSTLFHDKQNRAELRDGSNKWAFGWSFHPQRMKPMELAIHILKGGAFTAGFFRGNNRHKSQFLSSQLLALDFDSSVSVATLKQDEFIAAYAFLIYPTPSSTVETPKTRVVFILDQPIHDREYWEKLQRGLIRMYSHLKADKACKDSARLYYGSTNRVEAPYIAPLYRLSTVRAHMLTWMETWEKLAVEKRIRETPVTKVQSGDKRTVAFFRGRFNANIDAIRNAAPGERHETLITKVYNLAGHIPTGWPVTESEIERAALGAALSNGSIADYGEKEVLRWINDAMQSGKAKPHALVIPDDPTRTPPSPKKNSTPRLTGGIEDFVEYKNEKPTVRKRSFALVVPCPHLQAELNQQGYPALYLDNDEERVKQIRYIVTHAVPNTLILAESAKGHEIVNQLGVGRVVVPGDDLGKQLKDTYHLSPIL